ncbi:MAG: nuclear transport factor 2 family protein, partial [Myxococcota bacterium]
LARGAVEIAAATDDLLDHADARSALAVALRAAGRREEAEREEVRATQLWEQKGATLLVERARGTEGRTAVVAPAGPPPSEAARPTVRRVRSNAAVMNIRSLEAAVAAQDAEAFDPLISDDAMSVDHTTGTELDRSRIVRSWRTYLAAENFTFGSEPLATLGEALALVRQFSAASGVARGNVDVGAYEREMIVLVEVDTAGRRQRSEFFAPRRLGDAIARLYERYAELHHEGPERERAAATARSVAALLGPPDLWPFAPDVEATDHRSVGWGTLHGPDAAVRVIRALIQLSDDFVNRIDDVISLRSDALLVRWTNSGTDRGSGGAFERRLCQLWMLGADGLMARWEQFDVEQEAEALARFDELPAETVAVRPVHRRVRPNAATAHVRRVEAAFAAR